MISIGHVLLLFSCLILSESLLEGNPPVGREGAIGPRPTGKNTVIDITMPKVRPTQVSKMRIAV